MRLVETPLVGAFIVEQERITDERGFFARTFDAELLAAHGAEGRVTQCNTSFNRRAGTLRGMHFQRDPHGEAKLVRVTRGASFDVAVDLRPGSPTRGRWHGVELSEEDGRAFLIPSGFAHGFQTLCDATELLYVMSTPYVPDAAAGVRWNDPAFAIAWPDPPAGGERTISERDRTYPDWAP